jgi:hypothetical protein
MKRRKVAAFLLITFVLLVIDWILGVLIVQGMIPHWVYLPANIPFGVIYVWTEAQWVGDHYQLLGRAVNDIWVNIAQFSAIGFQALVYYGIWEVWKRKHDPMHPS